MASFKTILIRGMQKKKMCYILREQPVGLFSIHDSFAPFPVFCSSLPMYENADYNRRQVKPKCKISNYQYRHSSSNDLKEPVPSVARQKTDDFCISEFQNENYKKTDKKEDFMNQKSRVRALSGFNAPVIDTNSEQKSTVACTKNAKCDAIQKSDSDKEARNEEQKEDNTLRKPGTKNVGCIFGSKVRNCKRTADTLEDSSSKSKTISESSPHSTIDLSSNPTFTIIPVKNSDIGKKRDMLIKLKNIPDSVDVIKINSALSQLKLYVKDTKQSNCILKNQKKTESLKNNMEFEKTYRKLFSTKMTSPNKSLSSIPPRIVFEKPSTEHVSKDLRCYKKNDCFYDG